MRGTIAKILLLTGRLFGIAAMIVDAKTVEAESIKVLAKTNRASPTLIHEAQHSIKLDNKTINHIGQYL